MTSPNRNPIELDLAARALEIMPGGVSHDGRQLNPLGLFISSASGARKNGPDGKSYIDFACGNGALMLGHGHAASEQAALAAIAKGFHFSAGSDAEVRWAEQVLALMPAAQQIRFTSSGNEACLLALAIARAMTGRGAILTLDGHYHGWAAPAVLARLSVDSFLANPQKRTSELVVVEAPDIASAIAALASRRFAAVILEPTGASFGKLPLERQSVSALVDAARAAESLTIFDETITGFRVSPGGAQALWHLAPDLTVLGKILGGGLPCGALAGRADLLKALDNQPSRSVGYVSHMGTGNGNPVVASVGLATLRALADGTAIAHANAVCERLRCGLNALFEARNLAWAAYGHASGFHLFLNPEGRVFRPTQFDASTITKTEHGARNAELVNALRIALLAEGIDINPWPGGLVCAAHTASIIDEAIEGFSRALTSLSIQQVQLTGWQN
jgi:glutamate-1-semialdehyde 2,1-aminomutase